MKKGSKVVSLKDHKNMMELMKQLYGNDEVKDDSTNSNTHREPRAKVASKVAESSPSA